MTDTIPVVGYTRGGPEKNVTPCRDKNNPIANLNATEQRVGRSEFYPKYQAWSFRGFSRRGSKSTVLEKQVISPCNNSSLHDNVLFIAETAHIS